MSEGMLIVPAFMLLILAKPLHCTSVERVYDVVLGRAGMPEMEAVQLQLYPGVLVVFVWGRATRLELLHVHTAVTLSKAV